MSREEEPLDALIVDDHVLVWQALRAMLEGYDDAQVVGEAAKNQDTAGLPPIKEQR